MMTKKNVAPYIIGINVLVFVIMFITDPSISSTTLINFGAKFNYHIVEGQWWRFVTAMFLHLDFMHILFNMAALFILSRPLEHLFGKVKFIAIYMLSGIGGVALSFAFNNSLSAGASGAIFGLLGAHLYLYFRNKDAYRMIFGYDFLLLIGINLVYGFVNPGIDNLGHLGGLFAGFGAAHLLGINKEPINMKKGLAVFLSIFIAMSSSVVIKYNQYTGSANYYYVKVIDLASKGQNDEAIAALIEGYTLHPSSPELQKLIESLQ
ncbi:MULTISPECIES: rhomboid family intramembrane serine protease [unclassified Fusibacter]|uniref:rhomboid family intramembrane serine protease n=1 Tax=unclassified Fusibacter TaxID=2624464 RepID=UPI001013054D|nr:MULTISPECIES: rhomboid family intramembrane serine protease [unclassified Fusibacter]MCK8058714.1 rhomboid family intramembrane serine protease [Fusibacter sp. A2]NPE21788.1 rhomboid family intramembrane serine protease [Fusibacter sp. A1]RXV61361.1 rhomboid family intramembrane serine protease [Fusibacter sp. A1]